MKSLNTFINIEKTKMMNNGIIMNSFVMKMMKSTLKIIGVNEKERINDNDCYIDRNE